MNRKGWRVLCMVASAVCLLSEAGYAQYNRPKSNDGEKAVSAEEDDKSPGGVRIRKLTGVGTDAIVKTPDFRASGSRGVKEPQDWGEILVTFDTAPDWIDSLTLRFYVMSLGREGNKKNFSYYQLVVRYKDVEKGKQHLASAHLLPAALKRFGPIVAVGVEALVDDKVVATEENKVKGVGLPDKWWENATVIEKETVKSREGYLKARVDTPFALVDFDDYEVGE